MEAALHYYAVPRPLEELTETEFCNWLNEGIEEAREGRYLDFDTVFDELDGRVSAYE